MSETLTIQDTQIAIKHYLASLTLEGFSSDNGQSAILKSFISQLKDYYDEILSLPSTTPIIKLPTNYRSIVFNIQPYLVDVELHVEVKDISIKPVDPLSLFYFRFKEFKDSQYNFSLKEVAEPVKLKLSLSQRVNIYNNKSEYLETGIITKLTDTFFSVKTKYMLNYDTDNLSYCVIDNYWSNKEYQCTWESTICFERSKMPSWIHVKLYNVKLLYNCAWSLYYAEDETKDSILIAKGTDNTQPGYAYLSKAESAFKPGIYTLKSRIIKYGVYSTKAKQIKWKLSTINNFIKND